MRRRHIDEPRITRQIFDRDALMIDLVKHAAVYGASAEALAEMDGGEQSNGLAQFFKKR